MSRFNLSDHAASGLERAKKFADEKGGAFSKAKNFITGDAQFFSAVPKLDEIRKQLNDNSISEKKIGMKRIIAGICKGNDMSAVFPDVVKNIHVSSIELRKLVYYYIVHYSEDQPNESLLSISAFQKDLVDPSIHVRSLALRMLSSIRIPAIHPVVMFAIKTCSTDTAPVVRKTAAISLSQAHQMSGGDETEESIVQSIHHFLGDKFTQVVGAAAVSFSEICPNQIELLHRHFRKICRQLIDCDQFAQVVLLNCLLRYARTQFLDPNAEKPNTTINHPVLKANDAGDSDVTTPETTDDESEKESIDMLNDDPTDLDPDHQLLITSVKPLLSSLSRSVVVAAVSLLYHVAPTRELEHCVRPLLRLISGRPEGHMIVLSAIHTVALRCPELFVPYIRDFFLNPDDTHDIIALKIRIIASLTVASNFIAVQREFKSYLRSFDTEKVVLTVNGLGLISASMGDCSNAILQLIAPMLSHKHPDVVTECVVVLRQLVVQGSDLSQTCKTIHRLLVQLLRNQIRAPPARASILWLVGENIGMHAAIAKSAPDCFRHFAKNFTIEHSEVKKQILTLGCKLWLHLDGEGAVAERFKQIFFYVLELVKYDEDYELRDRGRIIECAVERQSIGFAILKQTMLAAKPLPKQRDPFQEKSKYQIGSISHLCGTSLLGYQDIPSWPSEQPDPSVRQPIGVPQASDVSVDDSSTSDSSANNDTSDEKDSSTSTSSASSECSEESESDNSDEDSNDGNGPIIRKPAQIHGGGVKAPFTIRRGATNPQPTSTLPPEGDII